jgi:hypothetical protein
LHQIGDELPLFVGHVAVGGSANPPLPTGPSPTPDTPRKLVRNAQRITGDGRPSVPTALHFLLGVAPVQTPDDQTRDSVRALLATQGLTPRTS